MAIGARRRPRRLALMCGALGLASACLDPAISDEPPISEGTLAVGLSDAGAPVVDEPVETAPAPSVDLSRPTRDGEPPTRRSRRR